MPANNSPTQSKTLGFTLIEVLIITPIALLVVTGLVTAMVAMISDTLVTNARSAVIYNTQDALGRIEQDARVSINFMGTFNGIRSPQGRDNGTAPFQASSGDLILTQQATTSSPYEQTRELVYYENQPNDCGTTKNANRVLLSRAVYFLSNGSLWRRTIFNDVNKNASVDGNTICDTPYQRNSCTPLSPAPTPNTVLGSTCQTYDERLVDNVTAFTTTYYTATGVATADPTQALSIKVDLTVSQTVAGQPVTQSGSIRVVRSNDIPAPQTPTVPTMSIFNPSVPNDNNPIRATIQWSSTFATYYTYEIQVGAGAWSAPVPTAATKAVVTTPSAKTSYSVRVTAYNDYGAAAQATFDNETALWTPCSLQDSWENYPGYGDLKFTMTSAKVVEVRGLVQSGSAGSAVCTLPQGFRPLENLLMPMLTDGAGNGVLSRVDIQTDGTIKSNAYTNWLSLSGIDFIPDNAGYNWTNLTPTNGWANGGLAKLSYLTDTVGRTQIRGVVNAGTLTDGTVIGSTLPSGQRPSEYYHLPSVGSGTSNGIGLNSTAGTVVAKGNTTTYNTITHMFYPSSFSSGWTSLALQNNWAPYSASTYTQPQYRRGSDGIVTVKGLIKKTSGSPALWQVIGQLDAGFRPLDEITFNLSMSGSAPYPSATGRVNIDKYGYIKVVNVNTTWTSLDNIKFYADGS